MMKLPVISRLITTKFYSLFLTTGFLSLLTAGLFSTFDFAASAAVAGVFVVVGVVGVAAVAAVAAVADEAGVDLESVL